MRVAHASENPENRSVELKELKGADAFLLHCSGAFRKMRLSPLVSEPQPSHRTARSAAVRLGRDSISRVDAGATEDAPRRDDFGVRFYVHGYRMSLRRLRSSTVQRACAPIIDSGFSW